jgi:taurine dioxygenase
MHRIEGMTDAESEALFAFLARHIDQPQFAIRWHWRPGDLAVWDERTTLHRGVGDHFPLRRVVRRCTVDGERPFFDADRVPDPRYLASLS